MKTTDIALLFCVAAVFVFGFIIASALDGLANGKKNRLTGKKASHTEKNANYEKNNSMRRFSGIINGDSI